MTDYIKLIEKLDSDLESVGKLLLHNQRNSALENAYVRTFFSTVEGFMYAFRQEAIASKDFEKIFDLAEQAKLKERQFDKLRQVIKKESNHLRFKESVKFSCKCLAKARGVEPKDLGFIGVGWDNFLAANDIRDQLTHPKQIEDLTLDVQTFEKIIKAKVWFKEQVLQRLVV
ncbi:hypothetical protein JKP09_21475 [Vibrio vulnificus]|uniref:hypothetical protein n=1 Tax=Vibrio vulnificus TaxID=672 RepID=UPI001CDC4124|nr:hypothetical protein [Vibrio vulnificus]MCA3940846.1 hypothetical protein [Vibrio vulnificus]